MVTAVAAYPAGRLGDAWSKPRVLLAGYVLGVVVWMISLVRRGIAR